MEDKYSNLLITPELEARQLPALMENGIMITDNPTQADMLLLGLVTAISHLLPKFYFRHGYPASEYGANLMTLILAPAASGKGILKRVLHAVEWHEQVLPGNASVSAFTSELARMKGHAFMMETEADVMSKALHQNGTDYSYLLRQAFEHETIRRARDGKDRQRIEIKNPHLSVLLSGTLGQLKPLLRSRENGLTSRFVNYIVKEIEGFDERVFGQNIVSTCLNANEVYQEIEDYLKALYDWQMASDHRCEFRLTDEQQQQLTDEFTSWYDIVINQMGFPVSFDSCIKRLAISVMRIGLVLNAVRLDTDEEFPSEIVCTDEDFKTMLLLVEKLVNHMVEVLSLLPEEEQTDISITMTDRQAEAKERRMAVLKALPEEFTTKMAATEGEKQGVPRKTVERWIKTWMESQNIERIAFGKFRQKPHTM